MESKESFVHLKRGMQADMGNEADVLQVSVFPCEEWQWQRGQSLWARSWRSGCG